ERGQVPLQGEARGVVRAGVLVALVMAERLLRIGRGLIDRHDDRAGGGVGLLPGVDGAGAEAGLGTQRRFAAHHSPPAMNCSMSKRVRIPITVPFSRTSTAGLREARRRVTCSTGSSAVTTGSGASIKLSTGRSSEAESWSTDLRMSLS